MQFTFLGYSVKKIMELDLDVKDVTILRYFDDFRLSGKMNYEIIEGVKYYWISYKNIENELPFLGLGKRAIMMRMLRLRDLGVLSHYTKKEGGTFSYYALGERYKELLYFKDNNDDNKGPGKGEATDYIITINNNDDCRDGQASSHHNGINNSHTDGQSSSYNNNIDNGNTNGQDTNRLNQINNHIDGQTSDYMNTNNTYKNGQSSYYKKEIDNKSVNNKEEAIQNNREERDYLKNFEETNHKEEERVLVNNNRGYAEKCSTNNHLLNNSSTIVTNIYNNIKDKVSNIVNYLNAKVGVMYKASNTKTINLVKTRLKEGFTIEDFKIVIDKKVRVWKGTSFEQYLTPFTLFGDKFEVYLNQNIVKEEEREINNYYGSSKSYRRNNKLRFDNFKGRDYDFDKLEKQLLGWD